MGDHHVLGLAGRAGSGKDYTCHKIISYYQQSPVVVERFALADLLRDELEEYLAGGAHLAPLHRKPYPEPVRWILQHYGTEYRRAQDPDYWSDRMQAVLEDFAREADQTLAIITDVRFTNEAEMIRRLGGQVAWLSVDPDVLEQRRLGEAVPDHASERFDFAPDGVILNNSEPLLTDELLDGLPGMRPRCHPCSELRIHLFHDDGDAVPWAKAEGPQWVR